MTKFDAPKDHRAGALQSGCIEALDRCRKLVAALPPELFSRDTPNTASVGRHGRHCLEHFLEFFRGLDSGVVDYDARKRETRLEEDRDFFLKSLGEIRERLAALGDENLGRRLAVQGIACPDSAPLRVESTLGRELSFLSSHLIHHLAIMMLLAEGQGISCDFADSLAYSTAASEAEGRD